MKFVLNITHKICKKNLNINLSDFFKTLLNIAQKW